MALNLCTLIQQALKFLFLDEQCILIKKPDNCSANSMDDRKGESIGLNHIARISTDTSWDISQLIIPFLSTGCVFSSSRKYFKKVIEGTKRFRSPKLKPPKVCLITPAFACVLHLLYPFRQQRQIEIRSQRILLSQQVLCRKTDRVRKILNRV